MPSNAPGTRAIGTSIEGRPILAHAFGPTDGDAALLVHGGIHGDEPAAAALVAHWLAELSAAASAGRSPPSRIVLVPAVNPDGLAAARKDNARGVDLNRNFPSSNFGGAHPPGYDPGPDPLSEPESLALATLVDAERPRLIVAVHQPFACVNFDGPARAVAERMAAASGWPVVADLGYPTPGSFGSCYGIDRGLPVITLELPPTAEGWLEPGLAALRQALEGALAP